jgi:hypothetical protein
MASTVTAATLTVTITESITLNGSDQGATNSFTVASVAEVNKRIVNCPASDKTILTFGAAIEAGQFIVGDVRYVRLTNKDDTNYVTLNIEGATATDYSVRLDPGASYLIISTSATGVDDYADISGVTLEALTGIKATANSAACDLEVLVASV